MTPELQAAADAAIAKAVKAYQIAVNGLTERQVCEAFKQAIACGDFERLVAPSAYDSIQQAVTYIPFRELERKDSELRKLKESHAFILRLLAMVLMKCGTQRIDTAFYMPPEPISILTHHPPGEADALIIELGKETEP